ncbi:MAG: hypothetical protein JO331_09665 [Verrucomicrobia bacterium]|nr:hypothetical protein [Verrucomicrobiota bacterium]
MEKISQSEMELATQLIAGMSGKFELEKYRDTYTEEVQKLIEAKAKGQKLQATAPKTPKEQRHRLGRRSPGKLGKREKGQKTLCCVRRASTP